MLTKTFTGGIITFICFGILFGYTIFQFIQAHNLTLNENISVTSNTVFLADSENFANLNIGANLMASTFAIHTSQPIPPEYGSITA
jgi:hypothetical protein